MCIRDRERERERERERVGERGFNDLKLFREVKISENCLLHAENYFIAKSICLRTKSPSKLYIFFWQWLCGSVGRAAASDTRGRQFESSHRQKFNYIEHLFPVNCVLKRRK